MNRRQNLRALLALLIVVAAFASPGFAQEKVEGTVLSTELTLCEFKPGGCEGTLVLATKSAGKSKQMTIKVPKGTFIKKGDEFVYLPTLRKNLVAVVYVMKKGEAVAKSIEVVQTSKP